MNIGVDFDGVICEAQPPIKFPFLWQQVRYNKSFKKTVKPYLLNEFNRDEVVCITGRTEFYRNITEEWAKKHNLNIKIHYMPYSRTTKNMIKWKTEMIEKLNIDVFYEDDNRIIKGLRKNLPNTKIIKVN